MNSTPAQPAADKAAPCPWCDAAATEQDEWGWLITHKPTCYWVNYHGDPIGRVRVNFSEVEKWNARAQSAAVEGLVTALKPVQPQLEAQQTAGCSGSDLLTIYIKVRDVKAVLAALAAVEQKGKVS